MVVKVKDKYEREDLGEWWGDAVKDKAKFTSNS